MCSHHPFTNDALRDVDMYHGYDLARLCSRIVWKDHMPRTAKIFLYLVQPFFATFALSILYPLFCIYDYVFKTSCIYTMVPNKNEITRKFILEMSIQLLVSLFVMTVPFLSTSYDWWMKMALCLIPFYTSSILFIVITQPAHLSTAPQIATENQIQSKDNCTFIEKQIVRSLDVNPTSKFLCWTTGGLNLQSLHHTFPQVHSSHYTDLYGKYLEICISYRTVPQTQSSFANAFKSYLRFIKLINLECNDNYSRLECPPTSYSRTIRFWSTFCVTLFILPFILFISSELYPKMFNSLKLFHKTS